MAKPLLTSLLLLSAVSTLYVLSRSPQMIKIRTNQYGVDLTPTQISEIWECLTNKQPWPEHLPELEMKDVEFLMELLEQTLQERSKSLLH